MRETDTSSEEGRGKLVARTRDEMRHYALRLEPQDGSILRPFDWDIDGDHVDSRIL